MLRVLNRLKNKVKMKLKKLKTPNNKINLNQKILLKLKKNNHSLLKQKFMID